MRCYFYYEDAGDESVLNYVFVSSLVTRTFTWSTLLTPKNLVVILNREDAKDYIKAYQKAYIQDQSDVDFKDCLEHRARPDDVNWLNLFDVFKVDEISLERAT